MPTDDETDDKGEKKPVPYEQFAKLRKQLTESKAKIAEYEKSAPEAGKLAAERDAAKAELATFQTRYTFDMELTRRGVTDPDDLAYVRSRYDMAGEPGKEKPDPAAWLESIGEKRWFKSMLPEGAGEQVDPNADAKTEFQAGKTGAKNEEGKGEPKAGDGKGAPDPKSAKPNAGAGTGAKPAVNPNAGTRGASNANGRPAFSRGDIRGMDVDTYREQRAAVLQAARSGGIDG